MTLKEIVDSYLTKDFELIDTLRVSKDFRWVTIAQEIVDEHGDVFHGICKNCKVRKEDGEYVRNRFSKLRKKQGTVTFDGHNNPTLHGLPYTLENNTPSTTQDKFVYQTGKESKEKGTKEWTFTASNIPDESEIIEHFNIDTKKWKIVNIYHKTSFGGKYSITVQTNLLKGVESLAVTEEFISKLSKIDPFEINGNINLGKLDLRNIKPKACLIIPKQDAHWNMLDINGQNSIEDRFATFTKALLGQLEKCILTNNLEKIVYVVGSDEFNSEWTSQTTKGTPQQNILSYQESFEKVCEFNIETIKLLRFYAPKVEVVLLNGNHDHYVGWHLANLLKQVFKKNDAVEVNSETQNTKIVSYAKNLILLNHGDSSSPKELAAKFPVIAHDIWSNYTNYLVVCGDKHNERSADINGVICYQVPQLSKSVSSWSDKKQYIVSKPELLTFLLEEDSVSNILRKQIK